jgi:protoheme ferro-lyase
MRGHFLEVELNSLDPKNFDNVQYFFTKFKSLLRELTDCGIDKSKQEKQLVLAIMEKLGPEYSVFVSTFHSNRFTTGPTWTMPSLSQFIEALTQSRISSFRWA